MEHVGMVIKVVGESIATTVLTLAGTVELDMCLMVGDRGVLIAMESIAFLLNRVDQAECVASRHEGIRVSPVSHISLEVFITAPQDCGEHHA